MSTRMLVKYSKNQTGVWAPDNARVIEEDIMQRKPHIEVKGKEHKHCKKCNSWLPLTRFYPDLSFWDGFHQYCKECTVKGMKYVPKR